MIEQLRILSAATELLASSLDFETTLASLAATCVPGLADWCLVDIIEEGRSRQLAVAHVDSEKAELAREVRRRYPLDPDATRGIHQVMRTGVPEWGDVADDMIAAAAQDPEHERLLRSLGLRSYLIVPIALRDQVFGALTLVDAESGRRYGSVDVELAQELATRAAQAIENARLYRAAIEARREAEAAAGRLGLLVEMSEAIAGALAPDDALVRLAHFAVATVADYCVAYQIEETGEIRRVAIAHADPAQQPLVEQLGRAGPPSLDDTHGVGAVLRTGQPILVPEISDALLEASAQNPTHLEVMRQLVPRSSLMVPLRARDRTLGAVALVTTACSSRRYGDPDLAFASEIAGRAALLIDNARLYSQAQEATRARDHMLSYVSHDLRNLLHTIATAMEVLDLDPPAERRARTRETIRRASRQMSRLLEDLLDVTRLDEGKLALQRERFDPGALLSELISLHEPLAEQRHIRLAAELTGDCIELEGDRHRIGQALTNIIGNAVKFTPEGGEITLAARSHDDRIEMAIADNGPGIPADQLPHVFDRFWRSPNGDGGEGLGLAIAKGIAEAHGGTISVDSRPGAGARFTLVLPRCTPVREVAEGHQ